MHPCVVEVLPTLLEPSVHAMQDLQRADSLAALLQGSVGQLSFLAAPGAAGQGNDPALPFLGGRPELLPSGTRPADQKLTRNAAELYVLPMD